MKQVTTVSVSDLAKMAEKMYGNFVKAVVDIEKNRVVVDAEMHVDEEQHLLEQGSHPKDLWGINLHPAKFGTDEFIEFNSMVNIRPSQNNKSRNVEDSHIRDRIRAVVDEVVVA
jgi:hypothetical protein